MGRRGSPEGSAPGSEPSSPFPHTRGRPRSRRARPPGCIIHVPVRPPAPPRRTGSGRGHLASPSRAMAGVSSGTGGKAFAGPHGHPDTPGGHKASGLPVLSCPSFRGGGAGRLQEGAPAPGRQAGRPDAGKATAHRFSSLLLSCPLPFLQEVSLKGAAMSPTASRAVWDLWGSPPCGGRGGEPASCP